MSQLDLTGTLRASPGEQIPDVRLLSTLGRLVALQAEAERLHLVIFFYPGDREGLRYPELAGCTPEACGFRDSLGAFAAAGAEVFGVNFHSTDRQRAFAEREGLGFELLSDERGELARALGIPVWRSADGAKFVARTTLVIRRGGEIVLAEQVRDIPLHVGRVLAVVQALN